MCVCSKCTRCFIEITKSYSITTSQFSHSCDLSQMHLPSISSSSLPTAPPFHSMHSPIPFALRRRRRRKQTNRHSAVSQRLTCATFYTYIIEDLFAYYVQYQHTRTHRMRILWIVMRYVRWGFHPINKRQFALITHRTRRTMQFVLIWIYIEQVQ